jgi:uncharacterized protein (TIGR03437 family)
MSDMLCKTSSLLLVLAAAGVAQTTPTWTQKSPSTSPPARAYSAMAYDSAHGQAVLFGGEGSNFSALGDTWVWDGTNWTQKSPAASPPARSGHTMAYDSAHQKVVMFGGGNNGLFNDTWLWDGTNWTQQTPQTSPGARANHAMAYDSSHGQVVLFGGTPGGQGNDLNDTWTWDGSNWTQQQPQTSPVARTAHIMAYDSGHAQTVLFSGADVNGRPLDDTWVWNGTNWTQKLPQTSPPARNYASMSYDVARAQVVVFGGSFLGDTWIWDGTNWTQQSPVTSPQAMNGPAMVYDSAHAQDVMFGGTSIFNALNDTWTWGVPAGTTTPTCANTTPPVITSIDSASAYGGYSYFASGSWLEIKGSNMANASDPRLTAAVNPGQWTSADFSGSNAPTSLDGISVSINGKPAYVWYLSTGQLNIQAPEDTATGNVPITVTNCQAISNPIMFARQALAPGFLSPTTYAANGTQYLVAFFASDNAYVLNTSTGASFGVNSRPAKPGDQIYTYGIGFGDVTPSFPPGVIAGGSNALVNIVFWIDARDSHVRRIVSGLRGAVPVQHHGSDDSCQRRLPDHRDAGREPGCADDVADSPQLNVIGNATARPVS